MKRYSASFRGRLLDALDAGLERAAAVRVAAADDATPAEHGAAWERIAAGCELRFLPPSSPDFNPIEPAFAKPKQLLRAAGSLRHRGHPLTGYLP